MTSFHRGLNSRAMAALALMAAREGNWFHDLLAAWAPSGTGAGLRLCVRKGYLNFYQQGQSVADIRAGTGHPSLSIDWSYISETRPARAQKSGMVVIKEHEGFDWTAGPTGWDGGEMLPRWIANAAAKAGLEKIGVDRIVGATPGVIDLEVTIPTDGKRVSAPRLDIAALEWRDEGPTVVFWEAKTLDNDELRTETFKPAVLMKQIPQYRAFLEEEREPVGLAFASLCRSLLDFHAMAPAGVKPLDLIVVEAARGKGPLAIDPQVRLVLYEGKKTRSESHWEPHLAALEKATEVVVLPEEGPFTLTSRVSR